MNRFAAIAIVLLAVLTTPPARAARDRAPGFFEQSLDLPGMPAAVIPADMTGDGRDDLVVLIAYTSWGEVATSEQVTFDDIEGLVEVMNVVSSLVDRRELWVYPARSDGPGYDPPLATLDLDTSVHALQAGHPHFPLLAITDEGVASIVLADGPDGHELTLTPLLEAPSSLSGTGSFYADFQFLHHLDNDDTVDLMLPNEAGWTVYRGTGSGFESASVHTLVMPPERTDDEDEDEDGGDSDEEEQSAEDIDENTRDDDTQPADNEDGDENRKQDRSIEVETTNSPPRPRRPKQPQIRDIDNDGYVDFVLFSRRHSDGPLVFPSRGELVWDEAVTLLLDADRDLDDDEATAADHDHHVHRDEEIVWVGDLDGDGVAEALSRQEIEPGEDAGFKKEIQHAKRPDFFYRVYPMSPDLELAATPRLGFHATGYIFEGTDEEEIEEDEFDIKLPGGIQDLDGDGRQDLVAITLDFSLIPLIVRALFGSISLNMDFHPYCQGDDGTFNLVPNLDLSGKFKINLRNVQIKHLSQFAGDFNGDGRADFIQLGRGKKVSIHQGGPDCTYPIEPDRQIRFDREPKHLGLVRILDLDANGLSDLYIVHPKRDPKSGESAPVRVDLYLAEVEE